MPASYFVSVGMKTGNSQSAPYLGKILTECPVLRKNPHRVSRTSEKYLCRILYLSMKTGY